jgi:integrase
MSTNRIATKTKGVYTLVSENKLFKRKPDICYYIAFKIDKKLIWEKCGWLSEGYSEKLAAEIRAERIRAKRHGQDLPQQKKKVMKFEEIAQKFLEWSDANKCRNGAEDKNRYKNYLQERFANKRCDQISSFDLEKLKTEMAKADYAAATIGQCLGLVKSIYNKAADWNLYAGTNPVKKVKFPIIQNKRDRFLSIEEANDLLTELKSKDLMLYNMALISLHTGARAGELLNLKAQDIDFANGLICFKDTKNKDTRYLPMTTTVKKLLEDIIPKEPSALFFPGKKGGKINQISSNFFKIINCMGLNDGVTDRRQRVSFHTCRHSFASWLAIQGTPLYTISKMLGHKSMTMTERYAHLSPDIKKTAIDNLEAVLNGKSAITENKMET